MNFWRPLKKLKPDLVLRRAVCALCLCAAPAYADKPLTAVADLRYGVALYNYYLDRNLEALSELMVAKEKGGIQGHGDNPEIMQGGFNLAYGMERTAGEIFSRLLEDNRPLATRDSAWFYMARLRYLRGEYEDAQQALANISEKPEKELAKDIELLKLNLAMRTGELTLAERMIDQRDLRKSPDLPYLQFNLGAAFARAQQYDAAVDYFLKLLEMRQFDEGNLTLYDKAMTAAGYARLLQKDYPGAINMFNKVRLNSPVASRAMLGYGWAAIEMDDYSGALRPWQALAKRQLIDANTQEAYVAVPYVYEKMGYAGLALDNFRQAESAYLEEITLLDDVINSMQGHSIREALNIDRSADIDWLNYAKENQVSPRLTYLVELFSKEQFLVAVQEIRDLLAIQENFAQWQEKLNLYREMLDERENNRGREMDFLAQQELDLKIVAMREQRDELATELARLQREQDFLALISPKQAKSLERIERGEKNLEQLKIGIYQWGQQVMPREELNKLEETLRIHKGLMIWQAQGEQDQRIQRVKKHLADVNATIANIEATSARVGRIVSEGFDLQPYREKISRAEDKLLIQSVDLERLIEESQDKLRDQVLSVLQRQRVRLNRYLTQSRLAIARLLDVKASESEDMPAAAQPSGDSDAADAQASEVESKDVEPSESTQGQEATP